MKIYLMRHAQSWWQVEPSHDWDTSLTDLGHEQARRAADWLANHERVDLGSRAEIGALCSSPLRRAYETTRYIADALGLPVQIHEYLREATFHVASELPRAPQPRIVPVGDLTERYLAYRQQVEAGWQELITSAEAGPVLAVSHGGYIKTLLRILGGSDGICASLYNASLTLFEWRRGRWHLVYLNLWDHLPPDLRTA